MVLDTTTSELPVDFPLPSTCQKCVKYIVCPCQVNSLCCCKCCKCVKSVCENSEIVVLPKWSYSILTICEHHKQLFINIFWKVYTISLKPFF